jgi:hypothetical protein
LLVPRDNWGRQQGFQAGICKNRKYFAGAFTPPPGFPDKDLI